MGCASSSPKETATITAAPPKKTNNDNVDMENTTKKRERETTGGTEAMAAGISVSLASSDAENINPNNNNNQKGVSNNNNNNKQTSNASSPQPNKSSSPQNPIPPTSASSPGSNPVKVGNLSLRYAALTHRGRDPDFPTKPNQDRFGHHRNPHSAFFAVYDGHGPHGEKCSDFVRGRLPQLLKVNLQNWKDRRNNNGSNNSGEEFLLSVDDIHDSLHDAHIDCNDELRRSEIDDRHSGTTSVGVYLHDDRMTVANVGDSRIVLGTMSSSSSDGRSSIQAIPLSKDHTPYRQDEASRCVSSGARILSFGQIDPAAKDDTEDDDDDDDDVEDPPRVWARDGKYPGTAFTRSIGDSVAERFGVCAEPEMVTLPVSTDERLLVLASDGVFDVLSNQAVVDLCYAYRSDPVRAAEAIVERSHEEWLLNDDCCEDDANYDDMTVVIVYFHHKGVNDEDHNITTNDTNGGEEDVKAPPRQPRPKGKRVRQKTLQNLEEMGQ